MLLWVHGVVCFFFWSVLIPQKKGKRPDIHLNQFGDQICFHVFRWFCLVYYSFGHAHDATPIVRRFVCMCMCVLSKNQLNQNGQFSGWVCVHKCWKDLDGNLPLNEILNSYITLTACEFQFFTEFRIDIFSFCGMFIPQIIGGKKEFSFAQNANHIHLEMCVKSSSFFAFNI